MIFAFLHEKSPRFIVFSGFVYGLEWISKDIIKILVKEVTGSSSVKLTETVFKLSGYMIEVENGGANAKDVVKGFDAYSNYMQLKLATDRIVREKLCVDYNENSVDDWKVLKDCQFRTLKLAKDYALKVDKDSGAQALKTDWNKYKNDLSVEKYIEYCITNVQNSTNNLDYKTIAKDYCGEYDGRNEDESGRQIVRRKYVVHIASISEDGSIEGVATFSPSEKSDLAYGETGSYKFKGKINFENNKIEIQGNEWIKRPSKNFTFVKLQGTLTENGISGISEDGIWEMKKRTAN